MNAADGAKLSQTTDDRMDGCACAVHHTTCTQRQHDAERAAWTVCQITKMARHSIFSTTHKKFRHHGGRSAPYQRRILLISPHPRHLRSPNSGICSLWFCSPFDPIIMLYPRYFWLSVYYFGMHTDLYRSHIQKI